MRKGKASAAVSPREGPSSRPQVRFDRHREGGEPGAHFCDVRCILPDQRHAVKILFLGFFSYLELAVRSRSLPSLSRRQPLSPVGCGALGRLRLPALVDPIGLPPAFPRSRARRALRSFAVLPSHWRIIHFGRAAVGTTAAAHAPRAGRTGARSGWVGALPARVLGKRAWSKPGFTSGPVNLPIARFVRAGGAREAKPTKARLQCVPGMASRCEASGAVRANVLNQRRRLARTFFWRGHWDAHGAGRHQGGRRRRNRATPLPLFRGGCRRSLPPAAGPAGQRHPHRRAQTPAKGPSPRSAARRACCRRRRVPPPARRSPPAAA